MCAMPKLKPSILLTFLLLGAWPAITLEATAAPSKGSASMTQTEAWNEVDKLVDEQKFEAASERIAKIREAARAAGNDAEWTRALIREVQVRTGLHGYETAVRFLREQPWPQSFLAKATLELYYGRTLLTYLQAYDWEIRQREKVETTGPIDLKAWTTDQIFDEALRAYQEVWKNRAELSNEPVSALGEYIRPNNYPSHIRGTLRDAVSYLTVELLANSAYWRPGQSNDLFRLEFRALVSGDPANSRNVAIDDPDAHPLVKIGAVLDDLETWHLGAGRREAALEARLERYRRLAEAFTEEDDRAFIRAHLREHLAELRALPWWSMGMFLLAEQTREAGDLVMAHDVAKQGAAAHPESAGGQRCRHLVESIEQPAYQLQSMSHDAPGKRSLLVTYRNLQQLHLRAWPLDLEERIRTAKNYNLLPNSDELQQIARGRPAAQWSVELPPTPDFKDHKAFITPPTLRPGMYVIGASAREEFDAADNQTLAVNLIVGDLVLVTRQDGELEVTAWSGSTGKPEPGVELTLYRYDWRHGHTPVRRVRTDARGVAVFRERAHSGNYFIVGRKGDQLAFDPATRYFHDQHRRGTQNGVLVYTDRSIYRPQQKLHWKVVAYRSNSSGGNFRIAADQTIVVDLHDANNQSVASVTVTTNRFGTASGEFDIPAGRALGNWWIRTSHNGHSGIRVEEYKRPTFEVSLKDPTEPLRLNRPARFTGEAKYYFGLPVTSGNVRWRVTREPVFPMWWGRWGWIPPASRVQTIATGVAPLEADGTFSFTFRPEVDERLSAQRGVSFRYVVDADLTDEGGETRSAKRAFRLGFVAVEATISSDTAFLRVGEKGALKVRRTDLDGVGRSGTGRWEIHALRGPTTTPTPSELPVQIDLTGGPVYQTPGDALRARWDTAFSPEAVISTWEDGEAKGGGGLTHDANGNASIELPTLPAGAYRVRYETTDEFGAKFDTWKIVIVADERMALPIPALLLAERSSVPVGGTARLLVHSGLTDQPLTLGIYRDGRLIEKRELIAGRDALVEIPIRAEHRGGFGVTLSAVRDHALMQFSEQIFVPWDDRQLEVEFATFRDLLRPGAKETFRVTVKGSDDALVGKGAAELLAYMYDRSLDVFAPHTPPSPLSLFPNRARPGQLSSNLGASWAHQLFYNSFNRPVGYPSFHGDQLIFPDGYGIGGLGMRGRPQMTRRSRAFAAGAPPPPSAPAAALKADASAAPAEEVALAQKAELASDTRADGPSESGTELRSNFAETAFWQPHLLTGADGSATIEFTVPDSVTSWNVWVHALTSDLRSGSVHRETRSVKELMVRPYVPRFFREGDEARLEVVVNNAAERALAGTLRLEIIDPDTEERLDEAFGLKKTSADFEVAPGRGATLSFPLVVPKRVGTVAFRVTARAGDLSDGELRPLPILPSRYHLAQSRFVVLKDDARRTMHFADLAKDDDPTRVNDQLVVTLDAQLFYTVLKALPYLVEYPYECSEQTLNRFLSTGIVSSVFRDFPAVAAMAKEMSKRDTRFEVWDQADPNRKMTLEESPWLQQAQGGRESSESLIALLDPKVAEAHRDASLAKLREMQTAIGGFPWFPGGPPSPYMTLYMLHGFAKALEFGVDVPRDMVQRGWGYIGEHFRGEWQRMRRDECCWEFLTFLNYTASAYPDASWSAHALSQKEREEILDFSFRHWKRHSPYLKAMLALTLKRMGRPQDAELVFASVIDSAKSDPDLGTWWAPEDRAWLWYNDTIETHAFALRTLTELKPDDAKRDGLVLWLLLNKKLNHWKSTRATAEAIYSLVHYMKGEGSLGVREVAKVQVGDVRQTFTFEPDKYVGRTQLVVPGEKLAPKTSSTVTVEKQGKGHVFASATWHFSTEKLPPEERGDFFHVSRRYFLRQNTGKEFVLKPLADGARLSPGDEVEVQLSLRSKHEAEYVHLRDPRAAGLEPENQVSRYKWDLGIGWYEEIRDSGTNFFFDRLPPGEYTFKYRLRANMAGTFRVGPATVQSMYAPEFNAYSAGDVLRVD